MPKYTLSKTRFLVVSLVMIVVLLLAAAIVFADPVVVSNNGTIDITQIASGRIFRDGIPSDCGGKAFPGPFATGTSFGYTVEGPFGPVLEDSCITVVWDPMACGTNAHPVAFLNDFDPAWGPSNATNYLGDAGSSIAGSFSFPVSAGDTFIVVFMNTSAVQACGYSYSFTYEGAPPPTSCNLSVPEGSVVGDTPYETQVYYEPGNVSPGIFLNPGTYIVIGQDQSEIYYKILLSCQFVWVRKDAMQPSYELPQNGAPLPTRIVDVPVESAPVSTGPAHD